MTADAWLVAYTKPSLKVTRQEESGVDLNCSSESEQVQRQMSAKDYYEMTRVRQQQ